MQPEHHTGQGLPSSLYSQLQAQPLAYRRHSVCWMNERFCYFKSSFVDQICSRFIFPWLHLCLKIFFNFSFGRTSDFQKKIVNSTKKIPIYSSDSPNVDTLHNRSTVIKTRKWTLIKLIYRLYSNFFNCSINVSFWNQNSSPGLHMILGSHISLVTCTLG